MMTPEEYIEQMYLYVDLLTDDELFDLILNDIKKNKLSKSGVEYIEELREFIEFNKLSQIIVCIENMLNIYKDEYYNRKKN